MEVIKRDGNKQEVSFDKVKYRIKNLCNNLKVDPIIISQKVVSRIYDGVKTSELDELAAQICTSMATENYEYGILASRIIISNNHKNTSPSFSEKTILLKDLVSEEYYNFVMVNKEKINTIIDYNKDYNFDYFAYKTLEKAYLFKVNGKTVERIQDLFMRVSLGLHIGDIKLSIASYICMSDKYFIHATPTLFHSGTNKPQLLSCFLLGTSDSVGGIYKTLTDSALISQYAGGIGIHISNIRSKGSKIHSTNGESGGIIPMLRVYNETAKYINQSGKRKGSIAIYLEPHHMEIMEFLQIRKNHGNEDERARDLFMALWISDLFMKRVESDQDWTLLDPNECKGLTEVYGKDYEELYKKYENDNTKRKIILPARKIWKAIIDSQIETGTPYILFKDNINNKSNQSNVGVIKSSNLCVDGNTKIITKKGKYKIKDFVNQEVTIWNGYEWSNVIVRMTGMNQPMMKVLVEYTYNNKDYMNTNNLPFYKKEQNNLESLNEDDNEIEDIKENKINKKTFELICTPYHKFYLKNGDTIEANNLKEGEELLDFYLYNKKKRYSKPTIKKIITVNELNYIANSYCFNEPLRHKAVFNNILTGQCAEIVEYSDNKEYACCTLASISLSRFVENKKIEGKFKIFTKFDCKYCKLSKMLLNNYNLEYDEEYITNDNKEDIKKYIFDNFNKNVSTLPQIYYIENENIKEYIGGYEELLEYIRPKFNYNKLETVLQTIVNNLNNIIDLNYYPVLETKRSNNRHRPLGIGVQGLADVYMKMRYAFDSEEAKDLNKKIFESIYYYALKASNELSMQYGPYETFKGSPISEGKFQFDLWKIKPSRRYDWEGLRRKIIEKGIRNSLLIALMPTATTSQIMGNNECFEPITSNIYTRRTIAGDFIIINDYLIKDLMNLEIWNKELKDLIIASNGSIQDIDIIPNEIKELYKTAWELKQKSLIDQSIGRAPFICQTQSLNLFFEDPSQTQITSALMYGWKNGLKTGSYYIRTRPKVQAQQFTIDPRLLKKNNGETKYEICENCSA
jgi:ribonucleotide reductase alpha subunit